MRLHEFLAITLSLVQFPIAAANIEYVFDFGVIIHNDLGEPIGFEKTTEIPIIRSGQSSLYGLVITSPNNNEFLLNSVHVLPDDASQNIAQKMIGKAMIIQKRGAVLLRTNVLDVPGEYAMEVYIDNKLHRTISYELISKPNLTKL